MSTPEKNKSQVAPKKRPSVKEKKPTQSPWVGFASARKFASKSTAKPTPRKAVKRNKDVEHAVQKPSVKCKVATSTAKHATEVKDDTQLKMGTIPELGKFEDQKLQASEEPLVKTSKLKRFCFKRKSTACKVVAKQAPDVKFNPYDEAYQPKEQSQLLDAAADDLGSAKSFKPKEAAQQQEPDNTPAPLEPSSDQISPDMQDTGTIATDAAGPVEDLSEKVSLDDTNLDPEQVPVTELEPSEYISEKVPIAKRLAQRGAGFKDLIKQAFVRLKHMSPLQRGLIALSVLCMCLLVLVAVFSWNRWLRFNDALDFEGSWSLEGSKIEIEIGKDSIQLTQDAKFSYSLDTFTKSIEYKFGSMVGHGIYQFSEDRRHLIIVEGYKPDLLTVLGLADIAKLVQQRQKTEKDPFGGIIVLLKLKNPEGRTADEQRKPDAGDSSSEASSVAKDQAGVSQSSSDANNAVQDVGEKTQLSDEGKHTATEASGTNKDLDPARPVYIDDKTGRIVVGEPNAQNYEGSEG